MPDDVATLLVINDDLMVSLLDWSTMVGDIALYARKSLGHTSGYLAEDGPFADSRFERLGAVGAFNVRLTTHFEYRFAMFENPHALPAVAVPREAADAYPRYNGRGAGEPARPTGRRPWFTELPRNRQT